MTAGLRTRIDAIEPRRVSLTHAGKARVRVQGHALGFVRCAGITRAVWGRFDESFLVASAGPELTVLAFGLGGSARERIPFQTEPSITPPPAPTLRHLRFAPMHVPAVRPLTNELLRAIGAIRGTADDSSLARPRTRIDAPAQPNVGGPPPPGSDLP